MSCISVFVKRVSDPIKTSVVDVSEHLKVTCAIVCSVEDIYYLRAAPKTLWVSQGEISQLLIESNVNWVITVD